MIKRYAIVRAGTVEQITLWDADVATGWRPPAGTTAVVCPDTTHIGAAYDGQAFTNPDPTLPGSGPVVGADNLTDEQRTMLKFLITLSHGA